MDSYSRKLVPPRCGHRSLRQTDASTEMSLRGRDFALGWVRSCFHVREPSAQIRSCCRPAGIRLVASSGDSLHSPFGAGADSFAPANQFRAFPAIAGSAGDHRTLRREPEAELDRPVRGRHSGFPAPAGSDGSGCFSPLVCCDCRIPSRSPACRCAGRNCRLREPAPSFLSRGIEAPR